MTDDNPSPHYLGHRNRLKEKFLKGGYMEDYELIELLLFYAIPRNDVKPLAKNLLTRFPTFAQLLAADPTLLKEVKGMGDHVVLFLKVLEAFKNRLLQQDLKSRPMVSKAEDVVLYCQQLIGSSQREHLMVLFLDNKNGIILDEVMQKGTVDTAPIYPREIVKRALEVSASAIILAHNHPSGDPAPSKQDIRVTKEIVTAAEALGIAVHDHIIIGPSDYRSLRDLGEM